MIRSFKRLLWIIMMLFMAYYFYFNVLVSKDLSTTLKLEDQKRLVFNHPEQMLPESNVNNATFLNGVAPLKIKTSATGENHYLVKIVDIVNNNTIGSYFIRSGESIDIKVPLGTYEIKYATGVKWYGMNYLFGPDTIYSKADSTFNFVFNGYEYSGYTIELIMQTNGNLRTTGLKSNQW